jgi:hypothetical protein
MPEVYGKGKDMETGYENGPADTKNHPTNGSAFMANTEVADQSANNTKK